MTIETEFIFTPENLLENLKKLGPWSSFYLAEKSIEYYHPECKEMDMVKKIDYMASLKCKGKKNTNWHDWIVRYQKEVGYKSRFSPKYVNAY